MTGISAWSELEGGNAVRAWNKVWQRRVAERGWLICMAYVGLSLMWAQAVWAQSGVTVGPAEDEGELAQVDVMLGRSVQVRTDWPVHRVSVSNPETADVQVLTPHQVLVLGQAVGETDLLIWSEDETVWQARVNVTMDLVALGEQLESLLPGAKLTLGQVNGTVMVSGQLRRAEHAAQLQQIMATADIGYVNLTTLVGVQQVMLQVRVAEASRSALRSLGVNFFGAGNDFFGANVLGQAGGGPLNPISIGVPEGAPAASGVPFQFIDDLTVSPGVTLFAGVPAADLQVFLQALAENQYIRILAEPNLVARSGEKANFLAGGEIPIPVVQGGTADSTAITVEYREFGVRLAFRPTVLGDGSIHLHVAPEVSELSDIGAVQIQGFRIPSISTRRAETTVELNDGQTFAMAGLMRQTTNARSSRVPVLGDLPVLGPLFRSVRYEQGETELVVLVTARLVEPLSIDPQAIPLPGMFHQPPSDWELYFKGRLDGRPPKLAPMDARVMRERGLDRLRGPGAWASYEPDTRSGSAATSATALPADDVAQSAPAQPTDQPEPDQMQ